MPLPLIKIGIAAAAGYYLYNRYGKARRHTGSTTNASDAVDHIELGKNPTHEKIVDAGVMETFPASDPVSVNPSETAWEKQERLKR